MSKKNFWNDASRAGAIIGLISIALTMAGMFLPKVAFVLSLVSFVITIYLLFHYTRRRSMLYLDEDFSYSQSLGFIAAIGLFAGIISGAYQIVASNFLFPEMYEKQIEDSLALLSQSGLYTSEMMEQMSEMMSTYTLTPMPTLLSNVASCVLSYCFYGLFISIGTKREADIFENNDEEQDE